MKKSIKPDFVHSPHKGYEELQALKESLFKLRMKLAQNKNSPKWTVEQIIKVCKYLKNNKAQDREGFIYELFKKGNCGNV